MATPPLTISTLRAQLQALEAQGKGDVQVVTYDRDYGFHLPANAELRTVNEHSADNYYKIGQEVLLID